MNNDDKLIEVIDKYGLKFTKERLEYILDNAKYKEVDYILNYLINDLHISPRSIEKCPSILYRKVSAVKENYEFLKRKNLFNYNVETCLHILATNHEDLEDTYDYVATSFGEDVINKNTTILRMPKQRIEDISMYFSSYLDDQTLIGACITNRTIMDIAKIIHICRKYEVKITSTVFKQTPEEVENLIKYCKNNDIEITGSIFHKKTEELDKLIKYCTKNNISLNT